MFFFNNEKIQIKICKKNAALTPIRPFFEDNHPDNYLYIKEITDICLSP